MHLEAINELKKRVFKRGEISTIQSDKLIGEISSKHGIDKAFLKPYFELSVQLKNEINSKKNRKKKTWTDTEKIIVFKYLNDIESVSIDKSRTQHFKDLSKLLGRSDRAVETIFYQVKSDENLLSNQRFTLNSEKFTNPNKNEKLTTFSNSDSITIERLDISKYEEFLKNLEETILSNHEQNLYIKNLEFEIDALYKRFETLETNLGSLTKMQRRIVSLIKKSHNKYKETKKQNEDLRSHLQFATNYKNNGGVIEPIRKKQ